MIDDYSILVGLVMVGLLAVAAIFIAEKVFRRLTSHVEAKVSDKENLRNHPAWRRYHVHYYIFALLFLAFDMEMAFMYPWAVVFKQLGLEAFADMGVFLLILFMGILYTWSQKGLERQ